jgi:hypothetical protein
LTHCFAGWLPKVSMMCRSRQRSSVLQVDYMQEVLDWFSYKPLQNSIYLFLFFNK